MKRVLFIAYHFPPLAGGGTFRSLKFVKYLPEFGWRPTVITTNTKNYWAYDEELLKEVPPEVKIIRAPEIDPFYLQIFLYKIGFGKLYQKIKDHFLIPDEKIGWIPIAYHKAVRELKRYKYDLIFSTSPTICAHIIALKLKRNLNLPWVCDFRDYWTMHFIYPYKNTNRGKYEKQLELNFFQNADRIITVSEGVKRDFLSIFPDRPISIITNGYDNGEIRQKEKSTEFRILYTGSFYEHYNPAFFLLAVKKVIDENPSLQSSFRLRFIGNYTQDIKIMFKHYQQYYLIDYLDLRSPNQLEQEYISATILLLILPGEKHYETYLPAKLFSYLNKSRPILAVIPDGEARSLLQKSNLGFFADPDSPEDIKKQILNLYRLWKTDKLHVQPDYKYIQQFHRRYLTKQLAEVFDSLV